MSFTPRFKCLIIDHDDTAVDSTAEIHYPAHCHTLQTLRPGAQVPTLDTWFLKNFHPGINEYLEGELGMTPEELLRGFEMWHEAASANVPHFFPGVIDLLREFRRAGGKIAVVSHSEREMIERDYRAASGSDTFVPDLIFGWDHEATRRKPHPWPALETLARFGIEPSDAIVLDDLKPGVLMARACGIPAAAAGWSHQIPEIRSYMESNCDVYFEAIGEFRRYLLGESAE